MLSRVGESDTQTNKKSCGDTENELKVIKGSHATFCGLLRADFRALRVGF
jgi:hypothetical protein